MATEYPQSLFPGVALPPATVRRRDYLRAAAVPPLRDRLAAWARESRQRKADGTGTGKAGK